MYYKNCFGFVNVFSDFVKNGLSYINSLFTPNNESFYYLSLINDNNKGWSIHGLWPQYSKKSYPTFCKVVDFDIKSLNPIIQDLHKHWYSTLEKDDLFWEHEWKKHGSCMFSNSDELSYFKKALELYVTVIEGDIIKKFQVSDNKSMIPFDKEFNVIYEL